MKITQKSQWSIGMIIVVAMISSCSAGDPIWNVKSGENSGIQISDDGSIIVVGGESITVLTRDGTQIWKGWSAHDLDISGDGNYLVTYQGSYYRLIDTTNGRILWEKGSSDSKGLVDAVISSNGAMIASAEEIVSEDADGVVRFSNNAGIGLGTNLDNEERPHTIRELAISNDGEQTVAIAENGLYSYNKTGNVTWWHERGGQKVAMSDDNTHLATIRGNTVSLFHASGSERWHANLFSGECISYAFSGDASTIIIGSNDNNLYVIDGTGKALWNFNTGMWVTGVAVSSDGSTIASGSMNKNIHLFDREGNVIWTYVADRPVKSVGLSKDGTLLVAATDASIYGFDTTQPAMAPEPSPSDVTDVPPQPMTTVSAQTPSLTQTTVPASSEPSVPTQNAPVPELIPFYGILIALFLIIRIRPPRND